MSHPLTAKLNPEQAAAVELPPEHALILAGAGSGKTSVLTTRIAWLLSTGQCSPAGLLSVTFTNKAAKEMLMRITAMMPLNPRGLWIGTFHGLCNRMLRLHWRDAGLPETFAILDSAEQLSLIKRILKALNIDDEKYPAKVVQQYINGHKENGRRAGDTDAWDDYSRMLRLIYEEYEKQCQREGVADFSELLLRCYELLSKNESLREHYQSRFRHILVDEFQDTNKLQYAWLKLLAGQNNALFAVGDDDQSIYAFRGANVGNMHDFQSDFSVKHVIRLEQNYRSQGNILDAANAVISNNQNRLGKELWTSEPAGEPIRVFEAATDFEEAAFIVEEAQTLMREGTAANDIAILYRANAQSRVIEHALFTAGVPYRVYGGLRFFERQEIKHALAYLRLIANPGDDNALLRVINFPTRGIGARTIESIQETAQHSGTTLWQAACSGAAGRGAAAVRKFAEIIETMRSQATGLAMPELVDMMLDLSGLRAHYQADKEGEERLANLGELINAATNFVQEDENNLIAFLSHASLEAGDHQAGAHEEALQLMTVHASKGLEFHAVFLCGLEEGLFPHDNSMNDARAVEEERRLMYVAITRARRRLYITLAQSRMLHGQTRYAVASRFMQEIPQQLLKFLNRGYAPQGYSGPATVASKIKAPTPEHGLSIGTNVEHPKFGQGVVTDHEGGANGNVQVNFATAGSKWLAVAYAKLKVI
ncbi:UvrD-helicase domain-containing protein [Iodobacter fluviatilis]|uniref:DNA 3'-5' helicase n=1 Tax=Iodobacter fluviatilis TaxID=537 RepID=A0A377Q2K4_9NEIS|nr:UvrD-helicase domain-containing protein [Iodobacter fluviatilis]TCU80295.1 ATP-dependent DNA helicase UvrD [Iodobacter fluviatilis]STQ88998.1 DNA helicase II [Iodobacter fluviatilis]